MKEGRTGGAGCVFPNEKKVGSGMRGSFEE